MAHEPPLEGVSDAWLQIDSMPGTHACGRIFSPGTGGSYNRAIASQVMLIKRIDRRRHSHSTPLQNKGHDIAARTTHCVVANDHGTGGTGFARGRRGLSSIGIGLVANAASDAAAIGIDDDAAGNAAAIRQ